MSVDNRLPLSGVALGGVAGSRCAEHQHSGGCPCTPVDRVGLSYLVVPAGVDVWAVHAVQPLTRLRVGVGAVCAGRLGGTAWNAKTLGVVRGCRSVCHGGSRSIKQRAGLLAGTACMERARRVLGAESAPAVGTDAYETRTHPLCNHTALPVRVCCGAQPVFLGGAYLLHRQSAPDIQGNEPKLHYADWGNIWRYKGPGFNPLNPTGVNRLNTYTPPSQCPDFNNTLLQTLLGTTPPKGTEIRGRLGYTNSELLIFACTPRAEAEKWLADHFPGCKWQPMDRHTSFRILEYEYCPAQYTPCFYVRLPDIDGAQRYIIRPQDEGEWIYLLLSTP